MDGMEDRESAAAGGNNCLLSGTSLMMAVKEKPAGTSLLANEETVTLAFGIMSHFLKPRYNRGAFCRPDRG
ncbi:hypothetical protein Pmani_032003 [Petrolisthes manimaculis]|uniref:Uncharacterized protein n=1 Tax=Petrolisthes manimaculis TaxID=1843537 RepID=A0AAE1NTH7_9EUCA|nr:hypothetical protein Pmani_032003 [Petrolisthes manimaculis]